MKKLITATGAEFSVSWCGVASIDGVLRFGVVDADMAQVFSTFTNAEETCELTYVFDEHETVLTGYTKFKGVDLAASGEIVVALMEG